MTTRQSDDLMDHYLLEWNSEEWARAYREPRSSSGPPILPGAVRTLWPHPLTPRSVPRCVQLAAPDALFRMRCLIFDGALRDESPEVWKEALDGLVALASPASIAVLRGRAVA